MIQPGQSNRVLAVRRLVFLVTLCELLVLGVACEGQTDSPRQELPYQQLAAPPEPLLTKEPAGRMVAINTAGKTGIQIGWEVLPPAPRTVSTTLLYRVGTNGSFKVVGTPRRELAAGKPESEVSRRLVQELPAGAENQPVVQLRWICQGSQSKQAPIANIRVTASSLETHSMAKADAARNREGSASPVSAATLGVGHGAILPSNGADDCRQRSRARPTRTDPVQQ